MTNIDGFPAEELLCFISETFAETRNLAEQAITQLPTEEFKWKLNQHSNSVAILMTHVGGFLRSRFTEFLTTDGEKPERNRDSEFIDDYQDIESVFRKWEAGWSCLEKTIANLSNSDLKRTIVIRGESFNVIQALLQALKHVSYHTGQIIILVSFRAPQWRSLSRPHKNNKE